MYILLQFVEKNLLFFSFFVVIFALNFFVYEIGSIFYLVLTSPCNLLFVYQISLYLLNFLNSLYLLFHCLVISKIDFLVRVVELNSLLYFSFEVLAALLFFF